MFGRLYLVKTEKDEKEKKGNPLTKKSAPPTAALHRKRSPFINVPPTNQETMTQSACEERRKKIPMRKKKIPPFFYDSPSTSETASFASLASDLASPGRAKW
jgi:hypothetical protein